MDIRFVLWVTGLCEFHVFLDIRYMWVPDFFGCLVLSGYQVLGDFRFIFDYQVYVGITFVLVSSLCG